MPAVLRAVALIVLVVGAPPHAGAQTASPLKHLSIEQLLEVDVTTAMRRAEPIATAAAAISVISRDQIRRSGVTTIADALQLADGVHVARASNNTWRISARGFNGSAPNKLLVMVDGRTINSSLFTTVFWNVLDYVLEDIDRIEVIRGPGAALWGASAVNGVVNIITRHARETQGGYASFAAGLEDRAIVEARYGGTAGGHWWRAYAKVADRDAQRLQSGEAASDSRTRTQAGLRLDGGALATGEWLVKADAFHSRDGFTGQDGESTELALQSRWARASSTRSRLDLQAYYRREYRRIPAQLTHYIDVFDVEGQHTTRFGGRHEVISGAGFRVSSDATFGSAGLRFEPANRSYALGSAFAQDEITILPNRLFTTVGAKYEHNAFSGGELQPSVRARLLLTGTHVFWGAVSRAVRRPTRFDVDAMTGSPGSGGPTLVGNDDFKSEKLRATEVGYRAQPLSRLSVDVTAFWHDYDDLRSQDALVDAPLRRIVGNTLRGQSNGVTVGANVQPLDRWRTHVGYTWLDTVVTRDPGSRDVSGGANEANDPHHLLGVHSSLNLPRRVELDAMLRSIGGLRSPAVPAYTELTLRLGWSATPRVGVWVAGQDLFHGSHLELASGIPATRVEMQRALRAGLAFRF